MRKILLLLGIVIYLSGFSHNALCFDVPLKFEKAPSDPNIFFPVGNINSSVVANKPDVNLILPKLNTDKPFYGIVTLGDNKIYYVLDVPDTTNNICSRMYFDCNGNGDLSDEKPVEGKANKQNEASFGGYYSIDFPPVDFKIKANGESLQYCIKPYIFLQIVESKYQAFYEPQVSFRVNCAYSSTFKVGKSQYHIRFGDSNGNGKFDDKAKFENNPNYPKHNTIFPQGDIIYLTDGRKLEYYDGQYLGDMLLIQDKLFEIKLDFSGGKMSLTEIKKGLSKLKLSVKPEFFSLYTVDGSHFMMAYKPSGNVVMIPEGNYKLMGYQLFRKDDQGDLWCVNAVSSIESKAVSVTQKSEAVLNFGEPFTPTVFLPNIYNLNSQYKQNTPISFNIEGIGKEIVMYMSRKEGTATKIPLSKRQGYESRPQEPTYTIIKPDGEIVSQGVFEYG